MSSAPNAFEIDDAKSVEANLAAYFEELAAVDPVLAPVLQAKMQQILADQSVSRSEIWDALKAALEAEVST